MFAFLVLISYLFGGCVGGSSNDDCPPIYNFLRPEDWGKIPYMDSTELTFINSSTNDTFIFSSGVWDSSIVLSSYGPNYCTGKRYSEKQQIQFVCPKFDDTLSFSIQLDLVINIQQASRGTGFVVTLGTREFCFFSDWPEKIDTVMGAKQYSIQNHSYFDVLKFQNWKKPNLVSPYYCYYNTEFGILKIETAQGNLELCKMKIK